MQGHRRKQRGRQGLTGWVVLVALAALGAVGAGVALSTRAPARQLQPTPAQAGPAAEASAVTTYRGMFRRMVDRGEAEDVSRVWAHSKHLLDPVQARVAHEVLAEARVPCAGCADAARQ